MSRPPWSAHIRHFTPLSRHFHGFSSVVCQLPVSLGRVPLYPTPRTFPISVSLLCLCMSPYLCLFLCLSPHSVYLFLTRHPPPSPSVSLPIPHTTTGPAWALSSWPFLTLGCETWGKGPGYYRNAGSWHRTWATLPRCFEFQSGVGNTPLLEFGASCQSSSGFKYLGLNLPGTLATFPANIEKYYGMNKGPT